MHLSPNVPKKRVAAKNAKNREENKRIFFHSFLLTFSISSSNIFSYKKNDCYLIFYYFKEWYTL